MLLDNLMDPWLDSSCKGFPHSSPPLRRSQIGAQRWRVLAGDLPLPLAVIKEAPLRHNLQWMQGFAKARGLALAPHGKTSMSPQLFQRQLEAGAWGMTFATVTQLRIGVAAGAKNCLIANQVFMAVDLQGLEALRRAHPQVRVIFLVDSLDQLGLIEAWCQANPAATAFEVLLELGPQGGRSGCRDEAQALALALRLRQSPAVRLVGVECYEGLAASGNSELDAAYTKSLMARVQGLAQACDQQDLFEHHEVLITAGGSALFDLVARDLKPVLSRPVLGLLRSGCYVTHDQGTYTRMMSAVAARTGCGDGLHAAMEVWASVQSCPEPGLAILAVGKRDLSYDWALPTPLWFCRRGTQAPQAAPAGWKITGLNDQHAYLKGDDAPHQALQVGDLVCLGISHPCTTFDKWRWIPLVDEHYVVCDAIVTSF